MGKSNFVEHLGWWPLNAIGSTMGSVAESYKKQSLARKQGSVEYMIDFIKLSFGKVFEDPQETFFKKFLVWVWAKPTAFPIYL